MTLPIGLYRVEGESMLPTLKPRAVVVGRRPGRLAVGRIVVAEVGGRLVIKRVASIDDGQVWLLGDNPRKSTDSRTFGAISVSAVRAVII